MLVYRADVLRERAWISVGLARGMKNVTCTTEVQNLVRIVYIELKRAEGTEEGKEV